MEDHAIESVEDASAQLVTLVRGASLNVLLGIMEKTARKCAAVSMDPVMQLQVNVSVWLAGSEDSVKSPVLKENTVLIVTTTALVEMNHATTSQAFAIVLMVSLGLCVSIIVHRVTGDHHVETFATALRINFVIQSVVSVSASLVFVVRSASDYAHLRTLALIALKSVCVKIMPTVTLEMVTAPVQLVGSVLCVISLVP